jgi:hypothetical protein
MISGKLIHPHGYAIASGLDLAPTPDGLIAPGME